MTTTPDQNKYSTARAIAVLLEQLQYFAMMQLSLFALTQALSFATQYTGSGDVGKGF
jgi:hypothetical protein